MTMTILNRTMMIMTILSRTMNDDDDFSYNDDDEDDDDDNLRYNNVRRRGEKNHSGEDCVAGQTNQTKSVYDHSSKLPIANHHILFVLVPESFRQKSHLLQQQLDLFAIVVLCSTHMVSTPTCHQVLVKEGVVIRSGKAAVFQRSECLFRRRLHERVFQSPIH